MSRPVVATPITPPPGGIKFEDVAKLTDGLAKLAGLVDKHLTPIVKKALPLVTRAAPLVAKAAPAAARTLSPPTAEAQLMEPQPTEPQPTKESSSAVGAGDWVCEVPDLPVDVPTDGGFGWEWFDVSGFDFNNLADLWG